MRIVVVCSTFNGLSQAVWLRLRAQGHHVDVHRSGDGDLPGAVERADPDLVLCPFLRERIPQEVWMRYPTIIIHPGPVGDRGPSSLDWAITDGATEWGVTALQAIDEMDAGPIWATRTFPLPDPPIRKSALYNGPVTAAAVDLVDEVVIKVTDGHFAPLPLAQAGELRQGRLRPMMRHVDRAFEWTDATVDVVRRVRAADGAPGVRASLSGQAVRVFDAHPGPVLDAVPGHVVGRRDEAVLVGTGDATVWIGHVRLESDGAAGNVKVPATLALAEQVAGLPEWTGGTAGYPGVSFRRVGQVGIVRAPFYNGAMSTSQCRRLVAALRHARTRDILVLVLEGGEIFSNGIHLNVIEAAPDPRQEAWHNINGINDVCHELLTCDEQVVVAAVGGNAGAGGVMLALGADVVMAREGVVLNPHYATMGLHGSEYWTAVLPGRVGATTAARLTGACQPVGTDAALEMGLVDEVVTGCRSHFDDEVIRRAAALAASSQFDRLMADKRRRLGDPGWHASMEACRTRELAEMAVDIFDDRHGFAAARRAFVHKVPNAPAGARR